MVRPLLFPAPWGTVVPAHTQWGRDTHSTPESHKVGWRKPNDVESDKDYVFQSCIRTPGASAAGDAGILFPEPERVTVTGEIQGPEAMRSMRSMRFGLFSAIEGPLLQRWYALPPAPRILVVCQTRTVMEGRHPRPRTVTVVRTTIRQDLRTDCGA